jgi:murein DD-endopeptidase MepM/ murein hydrolase activator NlpD
MHKSLLQLSLLLIILAVLMNGCKPQGSVTTPIPLMISQTEPPIATPTEPQASTKAPTPLVTPTPTATLPDQYPVDPSVEILDCRETFCFALWQGYLSRPIIEPYRNVIDLSYPYASTRNGELEVHHGVEFVNSFGTPVNAAQEGVVVFAGSDLEQALGPYLGFYGNVIIIKHPGLYFGEDLYTLYGHLSQINVSKDEQVRQGQVIGEVGASGAAIGSHLHFEVRYGVNNYNHTVNPVLWFAPLNPAVGENQATLAGRILDKNNEPVVNLPLSLEKIEANGEVEAYFYPITYHLSGINAHPDLDENFVFADLSPGNYRLAFVYGRLFEYFFALEAGTLGFIQIQLD